MKDIILANAVQCWMNLSPGARHNDPSIISCPYLSVVFLVMLFIAIWADQAH